jgi:monoamine oxidase
MNRRDFIKLSGLLGLSLPALAFNQSSRSKKQKVIIIGAGAAGLAAGYLLQQIGIDFTILEASPRYGGRMKRTNSFVDFPIPLGAEWLHVAPIELKQIVNNPNIEVETKLKGYAAKDSIAYFEEGVLYYSELTDAFGDDYIDKKFINSTWFDFFEKYLVPAVKENIQTDTPVTSVDYQSDLVQVTDTNGDKYLADQVIVTVPLKMLQNDTVTFTPSLPRRKQKAIDSAPVWGGIKVFLEFSERFYPTFLAFSDSETQHGQRLYFDAAYGQGSKANVLGLFAVGKQAKAYQNLSGDDQLKYMLAELDSVFDGKASKAYMQHRVQDWDKEDFIHSAYLADTASSSISRSLFSPVSDKLFFAGEAYTLEDDWGGVHNATRAARDAVNRIIDLG